MKNKFSKNWKSSKKPRKQRKYRANAPLHLKRKFLTINLAKDLRRKYLRRNFPGCKGDTVKILRGNFRIKTAKVSIVNLAKLKVYLEGIQRLKRDGTKANVPFDPSNLQLIELNLEDKQIKKSLERKLKK